MIKLSTIQKRECLNSVITLDSAGNGGAYHRYLIHNNEENSPITVRQEISFQNGARLLPDSIHGVLDGDLLEIVRHRLQCFQQGDFASEYNAEALKYVELALMYMARRVDDRIERGVLGINKK